MQGIFGHCLVLRFWVQIMIKPDFMDFAQALWAELTGSTIGPGNWLPRLEDFNCLEKDPISVLARLTKVAPREGR